MHAIAAAVLALTMTVSSSFAATQGALAPGKPAGTKQAQIETGGVLLVVGIIAIAAVIAVVASTTQGSSSNNSSNSTSGTTS